MSLIALIQPFRQVLHQAHACLLSCFCFVRPPLTASFRLLLPFPSLPPPLAGSSVISCVSCFFLSFGNSESAMIALLCLFGGISIASWNSLDVLTVELYPSDKR